MTVIHTLPPKDRDSAIAQLLPVLQLYQAGRPINVKVSIARPERTLPQLKYLWGVAYRLLADFGGYEAEEVSEYLCGSYWGWRDKKKPGGRVEQVPIRTTTEDADGNRDVIEGRAFWDYVEFVQRVGARQGLVIPDPDPHYKLTRVAA